MFPAGRRRERERVSASIALSVSPAGGMRRHWHEYSKLPPPRGGGGSSGIRFRYGRVTGPLALITWWNATGGLVFEHLPPELAPMARMLSWYFPLPVIPA